MVLYPNAQKLAQQELDKVCGTDRLPTIEDWASLPYIRKCVKETLRWMPTAILGLPHAVTQDDEYRGYKIPKDAGVMCKLITESFRIPRFCSHLPAIISRLTTKLGIHCHEHVY